MNTKLVEKIKSKINEKVVIQYTFEELVQYKFVPVDTVDNVLFVATIADSDFAEKERFIVSKISGVKIKVCNVAADEFDLLLQFVKTKYKQEEQLENSESEVADTHVEIEPDIEIADEESQEEKNLGKKDYSKSSQTSDISESISVAGNRLGDILIAKKIVTPEQLKDAIKKSEENCKLLGEVLIEEGLVAPTIIKSVLAEQRRNAQNIVLDTPKKRLGDLLIEKGYINQEQLKTGLEESKKTGLHIGSQLFQLGYITIEQLKETLSEQQGAEVLPSSALKIEEELLRIFPEDFIRANMVIPIRSNSQVVLVGMVDPHNKRVINEITYLTGKKVRVMLITHMEFDSCLHTYFSKKGGGTSSMMRKMTKEVSQLEYEESLFEQVERELQDDSGSVAKFANKIITDAIDLRASDIHIEPRLKNYVVRYRTDGILKEMFSLPPKADQSVLTRFKVLARMNIAEHRRPQDGTFTLKYGGKEFDFRLNTLPVGGKEKMVIRVLAPAVSLNAADKDIKLAGGTSEDIAKIKKMVSTPNGIILTTGPTGSGKTTTLYSILKVLNDEKVNITTIEDPVEIKIDGINQSQINNKAGITFASSMRAILRQDPDIILIGEIRDYETLETAISAALTGHLVLSTVHTNSAAATISRLIEMGAKEYLVASTVTGIIAQRLVRRLCPLCREKVRLTEEEARMVVLGDDEVKKIMSRDVYRARGCVSCKFDGYSGRLGVYEILPINKEIKKLIADGVHDIKIEEAAVSMGMKTLQQSCLNHILQGNTTISEFIRVLGPVTD